MFEPPKDHQPRKLGFDVVNPTGKHTMILLCGGYITSGGIDVTPLDQHSDYQDFVQKCVLKGWRVVAPYGMDYDGGFPDLIEAAAKYPSDIGPILVGHSAGSMIGLSYAKYQPRTSKVSMIVLFNCPLICPYTDESRLQRIYMNTQLVWQKTWLVMSKNDPLMAWKLGSFSMADAVLAVQNAGHVKTLTLEHSRLRTFPIRTN